MGGSFECAHRGASTRCPVMEDEWDPTRRSADTHVQASPVRQHNMIENTHTIILAPHRLRWFPT